MKWFTSKSWADQFWPAVATLVLHLGYGEPVPTSQSMDWAGVDFTAGGYRWAWRNRSASYLRYRDITIRVSRPSGAKTERHKLQNVDFVLFTWTASSDVRAWLVLRTDRMLPLLDQRWPVRKVHDAAFIIVPWAALQRAGAIVAAGGAIK